MKAKKTLDQNILSKVCDQIRSDLEVVKGYKLPSLRGDISKALPVTYRNDDAVDDVLAHLLTNGFIEVTEDDEVIVPEQPHSLTRMVKDALEQNQRTLNEEVRAKVPPSKQVRPWHIIDTISNGCLEIAGKVVRIDPSTLKVTANDKAAHGDVYFKDSETRRRQYSDYVKLVGVPNAVTPYEWMIRGWFTGVLTELVNSHPKVIEHRHAKANLARVKAADLYGDYWQESEES